MFDRSRVEPRAAGNRANQVSGYDEVGMTIAIVVDRSSKGGRGYFDLLQEDHERVCDLLRVIETTSEPGEREESLAEVKTELTLHSEAEENILPAARFPRRACASWSWKAAKSKNLSGNCLRTWLE